eukprot:TRINITY_DN269_c0_g1_i1.p1 TRINITY_DN269_c0_g1~~TRINITY_DN269_c0_g1_i1.p1  ORF type:complete len:568 (+),score=117.40 TRINITY_DN269_c0_g1_i1:131-1834(+)
MCIRDRSKHKMQAYLFVATLVALLATAQALTNTGHFRSFAGYDIATAGAYEIGFQGMTCKDAYLKFVILNSASGDGEDIEDTGKHYLSQEYPGSKICTDNAYTANNITGDCPRRILKQETVTSLNLGTLPTISSDTDTTSTTIQQYEIQFVTSKMETCTNTVSTGGDAHAGHNHRRSGDHDHGDGHGNKFEMELTFPTAGRWFIFSTADFVGDYEFVIHPEGHSDSPLTAAATEVLANPNVCSSTTTTCNCDCDDEKYMWSAIILASGLIGMAPVLFKQLAQSENVITALSLLNCLGGGVLLTVTVSHVFPEALELYPVSDSGDYPAAGILCAAGYLCVLVIDKLLLALCENKPEDAPSDEEPQSPSELNPMAKVVKADPADQSAIEMSNASTGQGHGIGVEPSHPEPEATANLPSGVCQVLGVFLAMSVHSFMAGIAVGLKCDSSSMADLSIAITCHKMFDVTTVGIMLVRAEVSLLKSLVMVFFVAIVTPIGIWVGIAGDNVEANVNGAIQAVASGMFFYVALQEVLATEFSRKKNIVFKTLATFAGIGLIALVSISQTSGGHGH